MSLFAVSGGDFGAAGQNIIKRSDGCLINIGGKVSLKVEPGVSLDLFFVFIIHTHIDYFKMFHFIVSFGLFLSEFVNQSHTFPSL